LVKGVSINDTPNNKGHDKILGEHENYLNQIWNTKLEGGEYENIKFRRITNMEREHSIKEFLGHLKKCSLNEVIVKESMT